MDYKKRVELLHTPNINTSMKSPRHLQSLQLSTDYKRRSLTDKMAFCNIFLLELDESEPTMSLENKIKKNRNFNAHFKIETSLLMCMNNSYKKSFEFYESKGCIWSEEEWGKIKILDKGSVEP